MNNDQQRTTYATGTGTQITVALGLGVLLAFLASCYFAAFAPPGPGRTAARNVVDYADPWDRPEPAKGVRR